LLKRKYINGIMERLFYSFTFMFIICISIFAQDSNMFICNESKQLYLVSNAHFDTQWNWTVQTSINNFLPNTLKENFYRFEKYPNYVFNFEGAIKYMWMKEYYPYEYQKLKYYIATDRWNISGSSLDANDVNIPSPESQIRNILLGQNFYKKEFNKKSFDIFLPDCFGFSFIVPSIAAHCGLKGFCTQKLTWGSTYGIPFDIGMWEGVDGSRIFAVLNPGNYDTKLLVAPNNDSTILKTINKIGRNSGAFVSYKLYGVGDRGGAPDEKSISLIEQSTNNKGIFEVKLSSTDLLSTLFTSRQLDKLPTYKGELPLTLHGTGCYTSQAFMKYINRKNELIADAAERSSVIADWIKGSKYPKEKLNENWTRFLWHQFHDDITGTSIPEAYTFSWNDELISHQQFSSILKHSADVVIQAMDTRTNGIAIVVYNALSIERNEPVEVEIPRGIHSNSLCVFNKNGNVVPCQIIKQDSKKINFLFLAKVPANGFETYQVLSSKKCYLNKSQLSISKQTLESRKYRVSVNNDGDVSSIFDKEEKKELLSNLARLELLTNETPDKAAWRIYYNTICAKPRNFVGNVKSIEIEENGPIRVSLKITRETEGSKFIQHIRLSEGNVGQRIDFVNEIDWNTRNTLLKASFHLTIADTIATYDLGLGTIKRSNNKPNLYEVPAQQWADITSSNGNYGISILNDSKYGWDKPTDNTLRLTLLHTPMTNGRYYYQTYQDLGKHNFTYSISGHKKTWKNYNNLWQSAFLNQPLIAFQTQSHDGKLGKSFSLASVNTPQVAIKTIKKAENDSSIVIRLQELIGESANNVSISFPAKVLLAHQLNGIEEVIGKAIIKNGKLICNLKPYQPLTFSVVLENSVIEQQADRSQNIYLKFNTRVSSYDTDKTMGEFDNLGHSLPAELLPTEIESQGVIFKIKKDDNNALIPNGDTIHIPQSNFNRVYLLAAATEDTNCSFSVDGKIVEFGIQSYSGFIGQWSTTFYDRPMNENLKVEQVKIVNQIPAYLKKDNIAWVATHRHSILGNNEAYTFCYLFKYSIDLPQTTKLLILPRNNKIRIMSITLMNDRYVNTKQVSPMYIKM